MSKYQTPRNIRRESRTLAGRFKGGVLAPVMAVPFRESESGMLSQQITFELDPIAGRMITPITSEMIAVYVPVQAIDALANPEEAYPGNTEVIREKLLTGTALFGLEEEGEISKRLGVVPQSFGGTKKVNEAVRLAHNAAVNYLRQRKYVDAVQLLAANTSVTPAIIGQTVLDRLNGVLDPEDRVDGAVNLSLGSVELPVHGLGAAAAANYSMASTAVTETGNESVTYTGAGGTSTGHVLIVQEDPDNPNVPKIYVDLEGVDAGNLSLTDFYNAELMDSLVRQMRQLVDDNPEYGEEMVTRWAHGLSVETGKTPFVVYENSTVYGSRYREATDGANLDVAQTDLGSVMRFTAPIPPTELGGIVITFAVLKPDETLASQPHPFLSKIWKATNYVSEELARDPVEVKIRELNGDCDSVDEATVAMYTGLNQLKRNYVNYGFNRHVDLNDVAAKTALWQLEVPMSVTPETVLYPTDLSHYPFADSEAEVCTYTISSVATVNTPLIFGPTPVEELAQIETDDLFDDA